MDMPEITDAERITARLDWLRRSGVAQTLTIAELDGHIAAIAAEFNALLAPKEGEAAAADEPEPAADTDSTGDAALDAKIAALRARYTAGELTLDQVVAATKELAAEITPEPAPEPAAAEAPARALASFLLSAQTLIKAVDICIDAYLEGRPNVANK